MKNLAIAVLALFGTATLSAQDLKMTDVPVNLNTNFQKLYPTATDVEWEMDGLNYKVEFDQGVNEHDIWYNQNGEVIKMKSEISITDLSAAVSSALKTKYAEYTVDSIDKIQANGTTTYEIELEKGLFTEKKVVFDTKGNVVSEMND